MVQRLAELIGILLGDGCIQVYESEKYSTFYCVKVTLDSREVDYARFISDLFEECLGFKPILDKRENENTFDIRCLRKEVVENLLDMGMQSSPKWDRAIIPEQFMAVDLSRYVLRGYFDTDGCLVVTNNNGTMYPRLEMKVSPSPMQGQFIDILERLGFRFGVYQIGKGKVRIQMNGKKELIKWIEAIGFSNPRHIKRVKKVLPSQELQAEVA